MSLFDRFPPSRAPALVLPSLCLFSGALGCAPDPIEFSGISAELHEDVGTMVLVRWTQDADADAVWLDFDIGDGDWLSSPPTARSAGEHQEWILGAPADRVLSFRIQAESEEALSASVAQTVATDPLPEKLQEPELVTWLSAETSPEGWVLGSVDPDGGIAYSGPYWLFIADRQGRIVWYRELSFWMSMFPRVARAGNHILHDQYTILDADGDSGLIWRMTLDGQYSEEIEAPGLGWCWDETDDGSLLYDQNKGVDTVTIQEISPDGERSTVWDCGAWMAPYDKDETNCYTNTVNWVPESDSILWSTYWGDYVVEVDRGTGEVLWHAGSLDEGLAFEPEEAAFDLQHYPNYTPDGTLLVSTHVPGQKGEQRAREFVVDEAGQVLSQVWSYGEGEEGYAQYSGEAVRLANGNTLLNYGTGGEIREVDLQGEILWSLQWGDGKTLGHTQLVEDLYALNRGP